MDKASSELMLPGFRFHPTEEELVDFYLRKMVFGNKLRFNIIGLLNIYHYDPWDLPGLSKIGEREWYFFVPRDRRHGHGGRPNRTTANGFWKATGSDRRIISISNPKRVLGLKKTLVFYTGRAPRGCKTDWVMNEYRMPDTCSLPKEDIVLCKIYRKATSLKVLEQRAAMEEEMKTSQEVSSSSPTIEPVSKYEQADNLDKLIPLNDIILKTEVEEEEEEKGEEKKEKKEGKEASSWSLRCQPATNLPELQLPKLGNDWAQDPFWTQLNSPWLDNWSPYMNILNF